MLTGAVEADTDNAAGTVLPDGMSRLPITFRDQVFTVVGRDADPYFASLAASAEATNSLFIRAVDRLPRGAVALDVGANIGLTCALTAGLAGATVYGFEPDPSVQAVLTQTAAANPSLDIRPQFMALGSEAGRMSFFANAVSGSASHLISGETMSQSTGEEVSVMTLDGFVAEEKIERIDLIKIDVEGFEIDVLRGATASLHRFKPLVVVEFNAFTMIAFKNINPRAFLDYLAATFPHIYRLQDGTLVELSSEGARLGFIHDVLVAAGCVDDLLCSFEALH